MSTTGTFSTDESDFIRRLAKDYTSAHQKVTQQAGMTETAPAYVRSCCNDPTRKIGSTDYGAFEDVVREYELTEPCHASNLNNPGTIPSQSIWDYPSGCTATPSTCSHDHSKERSIYEKPTREKLKAARLFREEGNASFKAAYFADAFASYKRALVYLDYTIGETDEDDEEIDAERVRCHLNMAAVSLELDELPAALNHTRLVLQLDPENSKALYRSGLANLRLGQLEQAQRDLYRAMKLTTTPNDRRPIEDAIRQLNVKWREYKKQSSAIAKAALR
jgi:tetratricopeptide (TPR) repeat protein